jgi:hypothetical protein
MNIFLLIYSQCCSTGYKELVGIYSTKELAVEAKKKDVRSPKHMLRDERGYSIREITVDQDINHIFDEW